MKALEKTQDNNVNKFVHLIQQGISAWTYAAQIAREQLALDSEWADKVAETNKFITVQAVHRFACIGVKFIPQLAISECPGARKLRSLPLETQKQVYTDGVQLLIRNDGGEWEELWADIHNLTSDQAAQVFADDHIRTAGEQRTWIEDKKAKQAVATKLDIPYRLVSNKLIVMQPCQFTRKELAQILANLE